MYYIITSKQIVSLNSSNTNSLLQKYDDVTDEKPFDITLLRKVHSRSALIRKISGWDYLLGKSM